MCKSKVCKGRSGKLFASEAKLKKKIKSVHNICADNLVPIRKAIKQFAPQMKALEEKQGMFIKMLLGWCLYIRIAFWMCFTFIHYCRLSNRQFHPINLPSIFFFDISFLFFSYRHIFETLKRTSIFLQTFIVLT